MSTLKNKIAIVTGGNSGIGFATAQEFIAQGAKVVITGRNQQAIDNAINKLGVNAFGILADSAKVKDIENLVAKVKSNFGNIDILFINAGIFKPTQLGQITEEIFDEIMNINFKGAFFTIEKFIPILKVGASIINLGSINANSGQPNAAIYSASKAALNSITKVASIELAEREIRVNSVNPGPISTPIFSKIGLPEEGLNGLLSRLKNRVPLKRLGTPEEVAKLITFLASDEAAFITGAEIDIDGGCNINV